MVWSGLAKIMYLCQYNKQLFVRKIFRDKYNGGVMIFPINISKCMHGKGFGESCRKCRAVQVFRAIRDISLVLVMIAAMSAAYFYR